MHNRTYFFEIKDLITQFIAAFDDVVIDRYNKNREPEQTIEVRYVYAPKQRVIYDIVNQSKNLTLPVVSVSITTVTRDNSRVFNKLDGFYYSNSESRSTTTHMLAPVPVNINVSVSIITKYQTDMDQIISNFAPYSNPYIILVWRIPELLDPNIKQEIRSEVLWDGNISLSYPTDVASTDKYRCVADTTFIIKGWLFKSKQNSSNNIYYINNNFNVESKITNYEMLSSNNYTWPLSTGIISETEFIGVSANP